jgi:CHAD domain-containing protein
MRIPMHDNLLAYFRKHQQNLEHYLALCAEETEPENVHQLRVSIKRLRAVLQFTNQVSCNDEIIAEKQLKSLRKLFKVAGSVRDVQVQQILIREYESDMDLRFGQYLTFLEKLEKKAIKNFYSFNKDVRPAHKLNAEHELIEKSLAILTHEEIKSGSEKLLSSRCKTVSQMLAEKPDDKKLHKTRTIIKQMRYILGIIQKSAPDILAKTVSLEQLSEAEVLLGKWHDMVVGIGFLKDFMKKADFNHAIEDEHYKNLAKKLNRERLKLRRQIRISLGNSFRF